MYIQAFLFDAFNHTPFTQEGQTRRGFNDLTYYPLYIYGSLSILDARDLEIYSTSTSSVNSTLSFTFEIPDSQAGGQYKIVVKGSYFADAIRVIRIRDYEMQQLVVEAEFSSDSYLPGDTVAGTLTLKM